MSKATVMAIADVRAYRNLTKTGRPTTTKVARTVQYYSYGRSAEADIKQSLRGEWFGPSGQTNHQEVMVWARMAARANSHTFQLLLSVRDGKLEATDYQQIMDNCADLLERAHVTDYRLIAHEDSAYNHAHCLFFADQKIERSIFTVWQRALVRELTIVQAERAQQQELALQLDQQRQQEEDLRQQQQEEELRQQQQRQQEEELWQQQRQLEEEPQQQRRLRAGQGFDFGY